MTLEIVISTIALLGIGVAVALYFISNSKLSRKAKTLIYLACTIGIILAFVAGYLTLLFLAWSDAR